MPKYPWDEENLEQGDAYSLLQNEMGSAKQNPNPFSPDFSMPPILSREIMSGGGSRKIEPSLNVSPLDIGIRDLSRIPTDLVKSDLTKLGSENKPGIFATFDNVRKNIQPEIPTEVDEFPEVDIKKDQPIANNGSYKTQRESTTLPPIPSFSVPGFQYPEFDDIYKNESSDSDSVRARRLLAYLNMAGNHMIKGMTGFDSKNDIPNAMLDSIAQDQKNAQLKKSQMADYLKNKYNAYNDNYKLKLQAEGLKNNAAYKRSLIGLKEKQIFQGKEAKENAYNKEYGKMAAKGNYDFDKGGGAIQGMRLIEETKQIARELRSKFYGKDGRPLQPGVLELLKKELGPGGQNWFNVEHPELAGYAQTLKRNYLNQMKTVMGERPTDKDTEVYLGTLFDWALSPQANSANLEAKANEMKQRLMTSIAMRRHALKNNGDMSGFDPESVPSGDIEILDE